MATIATETIARIADRQTGATARVTDQFGDQLFAQRHVLLTDHFEFEALESKRWNSAVAGGGSVLFPEAGVCRLATSATTNGSAEISAVHSSPPIGGAGVLLRAMIRYATNAEASNVRDIGFFDAAKSTRFGLVLSGNATVFSVYDDNELRDSQTLSGVIPPPPAWFLVEMLYARDYCRLWLNKGAVGSFNAMTSTSGNAHTGQLMRSSALSAYARNTNSGATLDNHFDIRMMEVSLIGDVVSSPTRVIAMNTTTSGWVIRGPGVLAKAMIAEGTGQAWTLRDGGPSGPPLCNTNTGNMDINAIFSNGLYFAHDSGATADTVYVVVRGAM